MRLWESIWFSWNEMQKAQKEKYKNTERIRRVWKWFWRWAWKQLIS